MEFFQVTAFQYIQGHSKKYISLEDLQQIVYHNFDIYV